MFRDMRLGERLPATLAPLLALALLAAGCSNDKPAAEPPAAVPATVAVTPAAAAKVASADGGIEVDIPAGSVAGPGQLSVEKAESPDGESSWNVALADTELTGLATLRFEAPERAEGEPVPVVSWSTTPGGRRTPVDGVVVDGDELVVRTDHFSTWTVQTWADALADTKARIDDAIDRAASSESAGKEPRCRGEAEIRDAGYSVRSDSGRRVYWCLGREAGRPVLKVVNGRGYGAAVEYTPGLRVTATDRRDYLDIVADLVRPAPTKRKNKVALLPPGNSVDMAVEGTAPTGVSVFPNPGAYLLTALEVAVEAVTMRVGSTVKASGKAGKTLMTAISASGCVGAMTEMATNNFQNAADAAKYFRSALSASFDCVGDVLDDGELGAINEDVVEPLLWLVNALRAALNGAVGVVDGALDLDSYRIFVTPPAASATEQVAINPFTDTGLAPGWRVDREQADSPVDCSYDTGSPHALGIATHSCGGTADAANACWASQFSTGELWCLNAFDLDNRTLIARSTSTLNDDTPAPSDPVPLFLELSDGSRFWYRIGGAWGGRADGRAGAYGCENEVGVCGETSEGDGNVILAPLEEDAPVVDTTAPTWTVGVGELGDPNTDYPEPQQMAVKTAWFIDGHRWQGD